MCSLYSDLLAVHVTRSARLRLFIVLHTPLARGGSGQLYNLDHVASSRNVFKENWEIEASYATTHGNSENNVDRGIIYDDDVQRLLYEQHELQQKGKAGRTIPAEYRHTSGNV